jgi:hypothetical protein
MDTPGPIALRTPSCPFGADANHRMGDMKRVAAMVRQNINDSCVATGYQLFSCDVPIVVPHMKEASSSLFPCSDPVYRLMRVFASPVFPSCVSLLYVLTTYEGCGQESSMRRMANAWGA